jgi:hypothetical protein
LEKCSSGSPRAARPSNALTQLWKGKFLHRSEADERIVLTEPGLREALRVAHTPVS